jgi:HEAT repeat protein
MKSILLAAALAVLAQTQTPVELDKGLHSKEYEIRLAAVQALTTDTDPRTEKLLIGATKDEDWEVALRAVEGLGIRKPKSAFDALVKLAVDAPIRRIRTAAAASLREISPEEAASIFTRKLSGNDTVPALEALAIVLAGRDTSVDLSAVVKMAEKNKDERARAAAAAVVGAANWKDREKAITKLVMGDAVRPACAALDAMIGSPRAADLPRALEVLLKPKLDDCVERRAIDAARAVFVSGAAGVELDKINDALTPLFAAKSPAVSGRAARLIERVASEFDRQVTGAEPKPLLAPDKALAALKPALDHSDQLPRALAARALARLGTGAIEVARAMARNDKSARVRRAAFESLCALGPLTDEPNRDVALALLAGDMDAEVRRTAAVRLGTRDLKAAVEPLVTALADKDWGVGVCAAVSLGLTQSETAIEPLAKLSKSGADWKLRAAAVVGLSHMFVKGAIPPVIEALADADPFVVRCAHIRMILVSGQKLEPKREVWREWWEKNKDRVLLVDPKIETEFRRRFRDSGTAAPRVLTDSDFVEIFRDQDVVVLESRGDNIQQLLARQKLEHRLTSAGKVTESGLSADSIFVANCTGEIETPDVERLRWFVLAGGNLFGSCWALHETIEKALPGPMQKYETMSEVLANVEAAACSRSSPHLAGVFAPGVQPIYALEGAHVIEVLEPERVEVLVDSPECAEDYGCGNLAAWFQAGHGHVLDSANHFEAQGLNSAADLKKPIDRQAYAVDHMGLSFDKLRAVRTAEWWGNSEKASREITDLSVFRIVTNFVRLRRLER